MMRTRATVRRRREKGHQIMEFALVAFLFVPLFLGTFVTGVNEIRSIQANHAARDLADMYIHGGDFSDFGMQRVAKRLASGMDLQVGTANGNAADNTGNAGRGIVWISKLMRVGTTAEASCQAVLPSTCTNANKFVFLEHIRFGNGTLETERDASVGHPSTPRDSFGAIIANKITTSGAAVPEPQQTALNTLWQVSTPATNRTALADGQIIYMVEVYFKSPDLNLGAFQGRGVYARWFF